MDFDHAILVSAALSLGMFAYVVLVSCACAERVAGISR